MKLARAFETLILPTAKMYRKLVCTTDIRKVPLQGENSHSGIYNKLYTDPSHFLI